MTSKTTARNAMSPTGPPSAAGPPSELSPNAARKPILRVARLLPVLIVLAITVMAMIGPLLAPFDPAESVAAPFQGATSSHWFGTDQLGRDVFSRVLCGGRSLIGTAAIGTLLAVTLGAVIGVGSVIVGMHRRALGYLLTRPTDALAVLPPLITSIVILTAVPTRTGIVIAVVAGSTPLSARVFAELARPITYRVHVEAALARGERLPWMFGREFAPLLILPFFADFGVRFTGAIYLVAAAGVLGIHSVDDDWATQVATSLSTADLAPLTLLAPLLCIAVLCVAVNLAADSALDRGQETA